MSYVDLDEAKRSAAIVTLSPARPKSPFGTVFFGEAQLDPEPEWLVDSVLPATGLSAIWGDPGCGKSFMALDLALAVARGTDWMGNATMRGGVAYLAAEGGRGVKKRLIAYRQHHKAPADTPFALIPCAVDLCTEQDDTAAFISELKQIIALMAQPLRLVVIDTLNRVMAGGNENDSQDMAALIRNADRIRQETGAHVLLVHHGGKNREAKTRGHSSLFGALDTAIEVVVNDASKVRTATVRKQKDGEDGASFGFKLAVVEIDMPYHDGTTSCVVEPADLDADESPAGPVSRRKVSGINGIALDALKKAIGDGGNLQQGNPHIPANAPCVSHNLWRNYFYKLRGGEAADANRMAFKRASTDLVNRSAVGVWGELAWVIH